MLIIAQLSICFMFTSKCAIAIFIYDAKREFPSLLSQNDKRMPKEGEKKDGRSVRSRPYGRP